jgi:hypothetical protein
VGVSVWGYRGENTPKNTPTANDRGGTEQDAAGRTTARRDGQKYLISLEKCSPMDGTGHSGTVGSGLDVVAGVGFEPAIGAFPLQAGIAPLHRIPLDGISQASREYRRRKICIKICIMFLLEKKMRQ